MCACPCTSLGIHHTTRWGVLTPLNLHVQILKIKACGFSRLLIRVRSRSVDHRQTIQSYFLPGPPVRLSSFLFVTREHLLYCSYLYISL